MFEECPIHGVGLVFERARPCAEDPDTLTVEGNLRVPIHGVAEHLRALGCTVVPMTSSGGYIIRRPGGYLLFVAGDGNVTATRVGTLSGLVDDLGGSIESTFESGNETQSDKEKCNGGHLFLR